MTGWGKALLLARRSQGAKMGLETRNIGKEGESLNKVTQKEKKT